MRNDYIKDREGIERKIRFYDKAFKIGIFGPLILGTAIVFSSVLQGARAQSSETYKNYQNAQQTLMKLEYLRDSLAGKLEIPYETPKAREALDSIYESDRHKISKLDEAISEIKTNPEFIQTEEKLEKYNKKMIYQALAGFGTVSSIFIFMPVFFGKGDKYRKKLSEKEK